MDCLMLSQHRSLCSLTSALVCAVLHTSFESQLDVLVSTRPPCIVNLLFTSVWSESCFACCGFGVNSHPLRALHVKVFGSNDKRSETALLHVLSVSLAASWAASFPLALLSGGHPRMQLNSASTGLLLNVARSPCLTCGSDFLQNAARPPSRSCGAPTSAECFEASPPQLCPGLRVSAAGCREHV